jgi:hypothetical protein
MSPLSLVLAALLAHNPDTSYARLRITEDKVETRLTYDVFTLLKFIQLDDNRDNSIQRTELSAHAPQIERFLRDHIGLATSDTDETADLGAFQGFLWPSDLGDAIKSADYHSANGLIHFDFLRKLDEPPLVVAIAFDFFDAFTDRHTILGVFECRGDLYETTFNHIEYYFEYSTGYVGRTLPTTPDVGWAVPTTPADPPRPQTRHTLAERTWRFFQLGVEHIFLGYDHICFLIALLVVSRFREIVKVVTSFTIAHSITLILAALDIIRLPSRLIEASIALTILYVALENLWLVQMRNAEFGVRSEGSDLPAIPQSAIRNPHFLPPRWLLTFLFGLIHGFGFANVLRELGLPTQGLVICLLSFNLGVEFGQLAIALCLLPLAWFLTKWKYGRPAAILISSVLAAFGLAWFLDRTLNLELMQHIGL